MGTGETRFRGEARFREGHTIVSATPDAGQSLSPTPATSWRRGGLPVDGLLSGRGFYRRRGGLLEIIEGLTGGEYPEAGA
jgi:hypothetical protein